MGIEASSWQMFCDHMGTDKESKDCFGWSKWTVSTEKAAETLALAEGWKEIGLEWLCPSCAATTES